MSRSLKILSHGIQSSIQDLGRTGYRKFGVPVSGAMDLLSFGLGNALLNNEPDAAVIEMINVGGKFEFLCKTHIVLTGADFTPMLNLAPLHMNKRYQVKKGDVLSFGKTRYGNCCYLAVKGGINSRVLLGSRAHMEGVSTYPRLMKGRILDIIPFEHPIENTHTKVKIDRSHFNTKEIKVYKGPEYEDHFIEVQGSELAVDTSSNRMAYQFEENTTLTSSYQNMLTSSVLPGTVQLTPYGQLIVLMRDCQTTGGYPRIFQLTEDSINILAQKRAGDVIKFKLVDG